MRKSTARGGPPAREKTLAARLPVTKVTAMSNGLQDQEKQCCLVRINMFLQEGAHPLGRWPTSVNTYPEKKAFLDVARFIMSAHPALQGHFFPMKNPLNDFYNLLMFLGCDASIKHLKIPGWSVGPSTWTEMLRGLNWLCEAVEKTAERDRMIASGVLPAPEAEHENAENASVAWLELRAMELLDDPAETAARYEAELEAKADDLLEKAHQEDTEMAALLTEMEEKQALQQEPVHLAALLQEEKASHAEQLAAIDELKAAIATLKQQEDALDAEREQLQAQLQANQQNLDGIRAKLAQQGCSSVEEFVAKHQQYGELVREVNELQVQLPVLQKEVAQLKEADTAAFRKLEKSLKELNDTLTKLRKFELLAPLGLGIVFEVNVSIEEIGSDIEHPELVSPSLTEISQKLGVKTTEAHQLAHEKKALVFQKVRDIKVQKRQLQAERDRKQAAFNRLETELNQLQLLCTAVQSAQSESLDMYQTCESSSTQKIQKANQRRVALQPVISELHANIQKVQDLHAKVQK